MRGIILDGVSASGKSSILNLVQQRIVKEYPSSTKLFISEHYTQRMLEHKLEAKAFPLCVSPFIVHSLKLPSSVSGMHP